MMSFLKRISNLKCGHKQIEKRSSLQAYPQKVRRIPLYVDVLKIFSKRMSPFFFCKLEAGITVEAAIALPFFLFFMVNLLSVILSFQSFSVNLSTMHQKAKELSVYAHAAENGKDVSNDLIIMTKVISIEAPIPVISFPVGRAIVNCRVRKWTGYDVIHTMDAEEEDEWVYITPSGSAYHRDRGCSYLNLSLHCDGFNNMENKRNVDGEKYRPCEVCGSRTLCGLAFYTEYGNRYHTSLQCSGLKRNVQTVLLSEAGSRHACSKCSQ